MKFDPDKHARRSIRLCGYDYTKVGTYFITACIYQRQCLLGDVVNGNMVLNEYGDIVQACWDDIHAHFPNAKLDAFVVMPNHVHGIIVLQHAVNATRIHTKSPITTVTARTFGKIVPGSLPATIRSFKSATTKRINEIRGTSGLPVWQRNYYEHIIHNEEELNRAREYISMNPLRWHLDRENPCNL
jgi:putative transposase